MRREIRCEVCGDQDGGPWLDRRGTMLCESCVDVVIAITNWARRPDTNPRDLRKLVALSGAELAEGSGTI